VLKALPQVSLSNCNRLDNFAKGLPRTRDLPGAFLGASRLSGKFRLVGYSRIRQTRTHVSTDRETENPNLGNASPAMARKIPIGGVAACLTAISTSTGGPRLVGWQTPAARNRQGRARLAGAHGGGDRIHLPMARPRTAPSPVNASRLPSRAPVHRASLGVGAVRYTFTVTDFHRRSLAGLQAHPSPTSKSGHSITWQAQAPSPKIRGQSPWRFCPARSSRRSTRIGSGKSPDAFLWSLRFQ
jgi:hypothetical protein